MIWTLEWGAIRLCGKSFAAFWTWFKSQAITICFLFLLYAFHSKLTICFSFLLYAFHSYHMLFIVTVCFSLLLYAHAFYSNHMLFVLITCFSFELHTLHSSNMFFILTIRFSFLLLCFSFPPCVLHSNCMLFIAVGAIIPRHHHLDLLGRQTPMSRSVKDGTQPTCPLLKRPAGR